MTAKEKQDNAISAMTAADIEKFWSHVRVGEKDECWPWLLSKHKCGYGRYQVNGCFIGSHRIAFILTFGPMERGICACHKCDNPSCCNPDHLFPGTRSENNSDMRSKLRHNIGERNGSAVLTPELVQEIRKKYIPNVHGCFKLAKEFGVNHMTIHAIVTNQHWKHV